MLYLKSDLYWLPSKLLYFQIINICFLGSSQAPKLNPT